MVDHQDPCPKCGGSLTFGYGLAGGGMGAYVLCLADGCDFFDKVQDHEGEPSPAAPSPGSGEGGGT